jgi:ATP-binding cassette subfamily B protein
MLLFSFLFSHLKSKKTVTIFLFLSVLSVSVTVLGFGYCVKNKSSALLECFLVLSLLLCVGSFTRSFTSSILAKTIVNELYCDVFEKFIKKDILFFDQHPAITISSTITQNTATIERFISKSLPILICNLIMFVGGLIFMCVISLYLAGVGLVLAFLLGMIIFKIGKRIKNGSKQEEELMTTKQNYVSEVLSQIKTVQTFCQQDDHYQNFHDFSCKKLTSSKKYCFLKSLFSTSIMFLTLSAFGCLYFLGTKELASRLLTKTEFSAFAFYLIVVTASSSRFGGLMTDTIQSIRSIQWINDITKNAPLKKLTKHFGGSKGIIAFHHVFFSYDNKNQILKNITFSITPGEKIGLVGRSGSGKSTLMSLLVKFYAPESGAVYIDGKDIKDIDSDAVREKIGWLSCEHAIFTGTIYDNISYGKKDATFEEIQIAAKKANIFDFILTLPKKFKTYIGPKGLALSQGERQRIAIARVFLKNPDFFLFDEATNSLDPENDFLIQKSLFAFQKTSIIATHRLSTVLSLDRIIFLENGVISGIDSHENLIKTNESYKMLCAQDLK